MRKKMQEMGIDVKRERKVAEENRREFYHVLTQSSQRRQRRD
jgi:hypothetical protein